MTVPTDQQRVLTMAGPTCGSELSTVPGYRLGCSQLCSAHSPQTPETGPSQHWASEHTHRAVNTAIYKHIQTPTHTAPINVVHECNMSESVRKCETYGGSVSQ